MKPRLVLLHGFTGAPASWDDVVAALERPTRILAPALLGHEPGDALAVDSFMGEVERLLAVIDEWAASETVHLAGYSLGARLALAMLVERPDRFASGTLVGGHPGLATEAEREERRRADAEWIALLERGTERFVDAWQRMPLWATQARLAATRLATQREGRLRHEPSGLQRSLRTLGLAEMPDLRPLLARARVPVDLMVGADDPKFLRHAEEMSSLLPDARVVIVAGAGHNLLLERPEAVARELNRKIR